MDRVRIGRKTVHPGSLITVLVIGMRKAGETLRQPQISDRNQTLANHRHAVKDYFPITSDSNSDTWLDRISASSKMPPKKDLRGIF